MANDPRHPHVLVVDDDPDTRELYHIMLGSVGYGVTSAGTVRAGVDLARKNTPNVVLTDWRLPDGDGFSVADALREHYASRHVPLIAVTGVSMPAHKVADMRARGFTEVIIKPASPDDILRAIRAAAEVGTAYRLRAATRRLGRYASQASRHRAAGAAAAAGGDHRCRPSADPCRRAQWQRHYFDAGGRLSPLRRCCWQFAGAHRIRAAGAGFSVGLGFGAAAGSTLESGALAVVHRLRNAGRPLHAPPPGRRTRGSSVLRRRQRRPRPAPQRNCPRQSAPRRVLTGQRVTRKAEVFHHTSTDEVFLNDALRV